PHYRLAHGRQTLVDLLEPAAPPEPRERPLHHRPVRQYREPRPLPAHERERPPEPPPDEPRRRRGVPLVGEHGPEPGHLTLHPVEEVRHALAVVDVGGVDQHGEEQPERVHEDVPLASVDALPAVEPARPADVARLHRLAVDDGGRRARLPPGLPPDGAAEPVEQPREEAAVTPPPEVV